MIADFVEPPYVDGVVNTVKGWAEGVAEAESAYGERSMETKMWRMHLAATRVAL